MQQQQLQAGELSSPSNIFGSVSECGQQCLRQPIRSCFIYLTVPYSTSFYKTLLLGDCFTFFGGVSLTCTCLASLPRAAADNANALRAAKSFLSEIKSRKDHREIMD